MNNFYALLVIQMYEYIPLFILMIRQYLVHFSNLHY
jgi:hypothetical protein